LAHYLEETVQKEPCVEHDNATEDDKVWHRLLARSLQVVVVDVDQLLDTGLVENVEFRELIQENLSAQVRSQVHPALLIVVFNAEVDPPLTLLESLKLEKLLHFHL
jgi:hypothetical protein